MLGLIKAFCDGYNYGRDMMKSPAHDPPDESILDEIAALEIIIERRKAAAVILEKQLKNTLDSSKRVTLITKLNTMDKQTLKDQQRINKLKAMV